MQAQDSSDQTGVADLSGHGSKEVTRARNRKAKAALAYSIAGADWKQVARQCGYPTPRAAKVAVERMLEKRLDAMDKEHLRLMVSARLDTLLRTVWGKATDSDDDQQLPAAKVARELIADYRRVWGVDAPQEILVTSPTQRDIDEFVAGVLESSLPPVENADIVEADVIDDETTWEPEDGDDAVPA